MPYVSPKAKDVPLTIEGLNAKTRYLDFFQISVLRVKKLMTLLCALHKKAVYALSEIKEVGQRKKGICHVFFKIF